MVSIVPNQYRIKGRIVSVVEKSEPENFCQISLQLEKVERTKGPEGLISSASKELSVWIPVEQVNHYRLSEGQVILMHVRRAPDRVFAIPDTIQILDV